MRKFVLAIVLVTIIIAIVYLQSISNHYHPGSTSQSVIPTSTMLSTTQTEKALKYPVAREIVNPSGFINTQPFKLQDLIGKKVILLDIWTYSCINCIRTLPYLNAWYDKYKDQGLEIVAIHTPEFEFEKEYDNVAAAVKKYGIKYPVVLDNDYGTWNAYNNLYWPQKYLIDVDGYVVYAHSGEGNYDETEREIQKLLDEKMARAGARETVTTSIATPTGTTEVEAGSPETYFGAGRNEFLSNGTQNKVGAQALAAPASADLNELNLSGTWQFENEYAESKTKNASVIYHYAAKGVYFVASSGNGVRVKVLRDGKPLTTKEAGQDITFENGQSYVTIKEDRLYRLIDDGFGEHTLELIIESPGLKAYTLTFG